AVPRPARLIGTAHRFDDQTRGHVGVGVGVRTTVLDVALLIPRDLPRNPHGSASVADAVAELFVRTGLVQTGEPLLDAKAVVRDVQLVALSEGLRRGDARVVALAHPVRRERSEERRVGKAWRSTRWVEQV